MKYYRLEHRNMIFENISLDSLTSQLQVQGLIVSLPHEYAAQSKGMRWQNVIVERINHFTNIHHKFEAKELHDALNTILRLVPPSEFDESPQEGGTVEGVRQAITNIIFDSGNTVNKPLVESLYEYMNEYASIVSATDKKRIEELEKENANLKTVMIAAAEEIQEHWAAHCDEEGYGPTSLMRRLEQGIPAKYGYSSGAFKMQEMCIENLEKEIDGLKEQRGL